ncbi:MAG TPA: ribosome biogenesis GTPase Der [Gaiellales bacterium]|jgi:GTP-binding protein|nr:ribosome biogenesis GTPase Der [Gaiellales bacterium]
MSAAPETRTLLGVVAVVGFPNAGKSTLINRLTASRQAVVHETPGVTRDRNEVVCEWGRDAFILVDTGGVDAGDESPMQAQVAEQARHAVEEADLVLLIVDARAGLAAGDEEIAQILRRSGRPVVVVANKVDDQAHEQAALELHALGLGEPLPVSSLHGRGTGDLLDAVVSRLHEIGAERVMEDADEIRVAILGRPNVGKSSLVNAILGRPRVIVADAPGTTRDSIDTELSRGETRFRLIDTAGLRRKRRHRQGIEYYSELRALQAAERADVALVLVDSSEGVAEGDLNVADEARKAGCATLVVLSKWDISRTTIEDASDRLEGKLRQRPAIVTTSALTGRNVDRLLDAVERLFERYTSRVGTGALNRAMTEIGELRAPPRSGRRTLNMLYATQYRTRPPRFRIVVNDRGLVTRDYAYFVENQLRSRLGLEGCPVIIDFRSRR